MDAVWQECLVEEAQMVAMVEKDGQWSNWREQWVETASKVETIHKVPTELPAILE